FRAASRRSVMEFHIRRELRERYGLEHTLFSLTGNVVLADVRQARALAAKLNAGIDPVKNPERVVKAGQLNAMGLIDEILHYVVALYREQVVPALFEQAAAALENRLGEGRIAAMLRQFGSIFPPQAVYAGKTSVEAYLSSSDGGESCKSLALEELLLLGMANLNPAFKMFFFMFDDKDLARETVYPAAMDELKTFFAALPVFGPDGQNLWDLLRAPALASPDSLAGQLDFMRKRWGLILGKFMGRLLTSLDIIKEEDKPSFFGPGPMEAYTYGYLENEYERFSPDQDWMPRTVLVAKSTLVWLFQLSKKYDREISRLDQIPDEELDELARRGFTGLWLIGLWERSDASRIIKQWTGNPEAAASAYSLYDYDIAGELGGWGALANLRERALRRGIRLGSDMVPNHTGIDSRWIIEHPDRFLQLPYSPFPGYSFNCGNLSGRDDITVQIEEHYFTRTDAAVVFRRIDNRSGETRYIYHGNDGTSMPWNDTAQIDFLNPEAREAVIRTIVGVCKQFPIVRFDAAMTLAKRHIQRLWYPEPGKGGDIASRAEHAISTEEFNRRIPNEFWREVVDRCAEEAPGTLLLAEAFWMMEGYFVRTLGMHRVYNSAFMNMLKMEENAKYRATIKNTLEFDPEILKRFVNFMNNPDEETAVTQFGKGDKYFGVCTLLVTMPGLPMFGHGQIDGFEEKYGMEYRRAYRDEQSDRWLVDRHEREIFPLMKKRYLFSGSADFRLYDFFSDGAVNENVFAYSNRAGAECALVLYNNSYGRASGWIKEAAVADKDTGIRDSLCSALGLHGEDECFVLMRELRSSLWYIRSSKDVAEHGLFAVLDGYQAQVFFDIHEVRDSRGGWARLNHELSGRGAVDLEAAKMDLVLGELYYRYDEIFKPGIDPAALKPLVTGFVETARAFIDGNGLYDPWIKKTPETESAVFPAESEQEVPAPKDAETEQAPDQKNPEQIWDDFTVYLERMISVQAAFESGVSSPAESACAGLGYAYASLALLRSIIGGPSGRASGADAVSLAVHWQLDRKLREILCRLGLDGESARYAVEILKVALSRAGRTELPESGTGKPTGGQAGKQAAAGKPTAAGKPAAEKRSAKDLARSVILDNYGDDDFRRILGINVFDDVTWFNKEAFERALYYGSIYAAMENGDAALIKDAAAELQKAKELSGYRLDALIEA
ncbi:MAG: alpha-amylase, partial [Treponema sp.]|nr:alpha-amylase [Treponema sp.]